MYSNDLTWNGWKNSTEYSSTGLLNSIQAAYEIYQKFYAITYGKTVEEIKALPGFQGTSDADIQAIQYAMGAFNDLNTALQSRIGYLTPFVGGGPN
jgi:hypothetical protein